MSWKERKACYGSKVRHYIISGIICFCIKSFYPMTWMFRIECAKRTTLYDHRCVRKCIRNFLTCSPNVKSNHFHTSYNETRFTQMFYFLDYFDKYYANYIYFSNVNLTVEITKVNIRSHLTSHFTYISVHCSQILNPTCKCVSTFCRKRLIASSSNKYMHHSYDAYHKFAKPLTSL